MKCYYDFHIHTALSPCGDDDMTPNNIVNMAVLKGLDAIAITDHNSAKNVPACIECAKDKPLVVIPGMEIETAEEIHMLALFDNADALMRLDKIVSENLPDIKNREDIFGEQIIYDSNDNPIGREENMLVTATALDIATVAGIVRRLGGVAIPAHIDKSSYSIVSNLGFIPDEQEFSAVEVKDPLKIDKLSESNKLDKYLIIHNSDAHYLWDIHEKEFFVNVDNISELDIINKLRCGLSENIVQ